MAPVRALLLIALAALVIGSQAGCTSRSRTVEVVVPAGTQERIDRGEDVAVMPARIELRVGDRLRMENRDVVDQPVGPYVVPAGEVVEITYGEPGEYRGFCTLSEGNSYEIIVTE